MHPSVVQPGGTGVAVFNHLAHHAQKAGDNPSRLGRWSWMKLKEKGSQVTHIAALYHPCFSDGPLSTYQQHCHGLAKQNHNENPQQAILTDLEKELTEWHEEGDHIILLTDFNEDVWLSWIKHFLLK